jgi:hypothetical protein
MNNNMNNIHINFIDLLPEDILNIIIYEYVKPELILVELKNILNSKKSKRLECELLYVYLNNVVLKNNIVVKNLIKNDEIFCIIYNEHIIENKKHFKLIEDPIKSMALSWLMTLYH